MPDLPAVHAPDRAVERVAEAAPAARPADPGERYRPVLTATVEVYDASGETVDAVMLPPPVDGLTEAQQGYLDRSTEVPSGRSYRLGSENVAEGGINDLIARIPPVPDWFVIYAHGEDGRIQVPDGRGGYDHVTPEEFAPLVELDPARDDLDQVCLVVCEADTGFASELYDRLDGEVSIMASDQLLHIDAEARITARKIHGIDPATGNPMLSDPLPDTWTIYEKRTP